MSASTSITLYDTTLRDGAQGEGINFSLADKLQIAHRLDAFGFHYIEGGWPGSNEKDIEFFNQAKKEKWQHAKIAAFGSTRRAGGRVEEDPQVRLLLEAETPAITFFGKTWLLHVTEVLRTTPDENLKMIADTVAYLKKQGREVLYDAEHCFDGYKDNPAYALACLRAAEEAGADYVVLCDTNGGTLPSEVTRITTELRQQLKTQIGIHTHNDIGLGVANALAAVEAGAVQVQGTINGYGERTGNCNLTTTLANLQLKMGRPVLASERLAQLRDLSLYLDEMANQTPDPRAPFIGVTAFAHKGGMHVNAVNKLARSFEHIVPETVGNKQRILVGELSGRTNVMMKARELGLPLEEKSPVTKQVLDQIKSLENQGYEFEGADASFELLVRKVLQPHQPIFELEEYQVSIRHGATPEANSNEAMVRLRVRGEKCHTAAAGDGPVNALDGALRVALTRFYPEIQEIRLTDYKVRIVNSAAGTAAKIRVLIESTDGERRWSTVGVSENVVEASWHALVDSLEYHLLRRTENSAGPKA
jgi:2-isopropylmalate synthase